MILLHRLRAQNFKQLADVTLCFPKRGTILIEGHNEAGKSSLFEAVFFALYGKPLLSDRDYKAEYLRTYGADELCVELDFSIEGRPYSIIRRLRSNQKASLTLQRDDGTQETIHTLKAVNQRVLEEMRISPESLLNTCFVEQKQLERLEGLNPADRRETINELLNLRVLTSLLEECRVSREEHNVVQRLRGRVGVARLDSELSALETEVRSARSCWLYSRLRDSEAQWQGWQREIEAAQQRQDEIEARREQITQILVECGRLRDLIRTLEKDLPLRADTWATAEEALEGATERVRQLQALTDTLSERTQRLEIRQALAVRLSELESLEAEIEQRRQVLEAKQQEITDYEALQRQWEVGTAQQETLQDEIQRQQEAREQAETHLQARQEANRRQEQLNGVLQMVTACERAALAVEEIEARLMAARSATERLPELRKRRNDLEDLTTRLRQRDIDAQDHKRLQEDLDNLKSRWQEQVARRERIQELQADLDRLDPKILIARREEEQATTLVREAQLRDGLETWAVAAERCAEFAPNAHAETGLRGRIRESEARREAATQAVQQAARQKLPGYGLIAAGIIAGLICLLSGHVVIGIVPALVLVAFGGALTARGMRAVRAAQTELQNANLAFATLEGECKTVEAQKQTHAAQSQMWAEQERVARTALLQMQLSVPATPAEARITAQTLTTTLLVEAQAAQRSAEDSRRRLENERDVAGRSLDVEAKQAAQTDPEMLTARITERTIKIERLAALIALDAAELPRCAERLKVAADLAALQTALQVAQSEVAGAEAQEATIADEQARLDEKQRLLSDEWAQTTALSQQLSLPGTEMTAWRDAARSEREALFQEQLKTPDSQLQSALRVAQEGIGDLGRRLAGLETEQARRQEMLEAKSGPALRAEAEAIKTELAERSQRLQPLLSVRGELERANLPVRFHDLDVALATERERLNHDEEVASQLSAAREQERIRRSTLEAKRTEFAEAWAATLTHPVPANPAAALECLPSVAAETTQRLEAQQEPELKVEDEELEGEFNGLGSANATRKHQQGEAMKQQRAFREELGVATATELDALPSQLPALQRAAEHDTEGWEKALTTAREQRANNRSRREAQAQIWEVGEELLDLRIEEEGVARAEQEIAVKRRSGEIVEKTRQAIVSRVMPLTMQNVAQLLPLLTEGRYSDLKWDEATNTLEIYDTRSRDYQRKRIFSGGARDQISLALRLGFALATLPGEHNVRPGWLFLDEPLSSFDRSRTLALVDLLTKGLIRREFAQILLISHSESFDPGLFDYRLRMESGSLAETTLPATY